MCSNSCFDQQDPKTALPLLFSKTTRPCALLTLQRYSDSLQACLKEACLYAAADWLGSSVSQMVARGSFRLLFPPPQLPFLGGVLQTQKVRFPWLLTELQSYPAFFLSQIIALYTSPACIGTVTGWINSSVFVCAHETLILYFLLTYVTV